MADDNQLIVDRVTIKSWFETGDIPTQSQFWATWDSYWHKSDNIPVGSIAGLDQVLADKVDKEYLDNTLTPVVQSLDDKVDKIPGKGLSTHDLTDELLESINAGMFEPGTNPLNAVYMNGNVGVKIDDPQQALHVNGNIKATKYYLSPPDQYSSLIYAGSYGITEHVVNGLIALRLTSSRVDARTIEPLVTTNTLGVSDNQWGAVYAGTFQSGVMNSNGNDSSTSLRLRGDGVGLTNAANGDIWKSSGNIWTKSGNAGSQYFSGYSRSLTGLGCDQKSRNKSSKDLNTLFGAFGLTSLVGTGYEYGGKLIDKGWTNIHSNMYVGAIITFSESYLGAQLMFDNKGQLFARGKSYAHGDQNWKQYLYNRTLLNVDPETNVVNIGMTDGDQKLNVAGNILINTDGGGIVVNSPDGNTKKMISIDNSGNVVAIDV